MSFRGLVLSTLLALSVRAAPVAQSTEIVARTETFNLIVQNNCTFYKEVGVTAVTAAFQAYNVTPSANMAPGTTHTFAVPFTGIGYRLDGHMEMFPASAWFDQALFEFGYSSFGGVEGTAYDLSFMLPVLDKDIGMKAEPIENGQGSGSCETKTCFPWNCPLSQGWTNPDQTANGNPADTVCYKGKSDFLVTYCPSE